MIPKIIHYCWFGRKDKPKVVKKYIKQWKNVLPDYQFIEWNEENFDINYNRYTLEAYKAKKYAFVSDVARLYALVQMGGVYLDTDIEVIKDFSELLNQNSTIFGFESSGKIVMSAFVAATKNHELIREFLQSYESDSFICETGEYNTYPNTYRWTKILKERLGLRTVNEFQQLAEGIAIYPEKTFSAMQFKTFKNISDSSTYTVHHFGSSWLPWYIKIRRKIKKIIINIFGSKIFEN